MIYEHDCTRCPLHKGRRTVCVPGRGNLKAEVLVLGQAPGKVEDATGECFRGPGGEILEEGLKRAGLTNVYLDNPVRCWPTGDREPTKDEIAACHVYTERLIDSMPNLKVVVTLGNIPLRYITHFTSILKRRGTPMPGRFPWYTRKEMADARKKGEPLEYREFTVLPTIHPSFLMRNEAYSDLFLSDLKSVPHLLTGIEKGLVNIVKGGAGMWRLKDLRKSNTPVAFDFETTSLDPRRGSVIAMSVYGKNFEKPLSVLNTDPLFLKYVREFLQSDRQKIVHNVAFESMWAELHFGVELKNVVADTMILAYRDDENSLVNLGAATAKYVPKLSGFKVDSQNALEMGEKWWELDDVTLGTRNAVDSLATYEIWKRLKRKLGKKIMQYHREYDIPIAVTVARMQKRGVKFDTGWLHEYEKEQERLMEEAMEEAEEVYLDVNLNSPKQLSERLQELGVDTGKWGKADKKGDRIMSCDEDTIRAYLHEHSHMEELFKPILKYRSAVKQKGTYIKGVEKHVVRGLVHSRFRFPGTVTWRLTSSAPNLMNLPARGEEAVYRRAVVSRHEGGVIVAGDYSQAELRVLASLSEDEHMIEVFEKGEDPHGRIAAVAYGKDYTKDQRKTAKNGHFAIWYGARAPKISQTLLIPMEEAKAIENAVKTQYPRAWEFMRDLQFDARTRQEIDCVMYGITRKFVGRGRELEKVALEGANAPIQCTAVMLTLTSMKICEERLTSMDGELILQVHDELVADSPDHQAGVRTGRILREVMVEVAESQPWRRVPFHVDVEIGPNWYDLTDLPED